MNSRIRVHSGLIALSTFLGSQGAFGDGFAAPDFEVASRLESSDLIDSFVTAVDSYAGDKLEKGNSSEAIRIWIDALKSRGIDPGFLKNRMDRGIEKFRRERARRVDGLFAPNPTIEDLRRDYFAPYRNLQVDQPICGTCAFVAETGPSESGSDLSSQEDSSAQAEAKPVALHLAKLDVLDEYDDFFNDKIYAYFIVTYGDVMWSKVTRTYENLGRNTEAFFDPEDRPIFGPEGTAMVVKHPLIVDIGLIESDGDNVEDLKALSSVIVEAAIAVLALRSPGTAASVSVIKAEIKNLLNMIIELDKDDRLVTDTLFLSAQSIEESLNGKDVREIVRYYERESFWSHFSYRLHLRLIRP